VSQDARAMATTITDCPTEVIHSTLLTPQTLCNVFSFVDYRQVFQFQYLCKQFYDAANSNLLVRMN
jgi:hypothetical protein